MSVICCSYEILKLSTIPCLRVPMRSMRKRPICFGIRWRNPLVPTSVQVLWSAFESSNRRVPAKYVLTITVSMRIPKETLYGALNLARATIDRKVLKKELLNQDESGESWPSRGW